MASSSSIFTPQFKHDVFLSFRGEDTRNNFTSHLNAALRRRQIKTFIDNQLIRGDKISSSLLNSIEESKISVIIFSKGYATSKWCLEELVKILECKKVYGQVVIPVFYHVDPSHVRNQTGTFGDGFSHLKERFKERTDMVQRWRDALTGAANLSGFDSHVISMEAVFIEEIVKETLRRLNKMSPCYNEGLVGVESNIEEIVSLLRIGKSKHFCVVGIWGMGGIGKTTIVKAVFKKIYREFEASYFAENVREEVEKGRLIHLRERLLSTLLDEENPNIELTVTKERLQSMRVLIVFDDITCMEQIDKIFGELKWLSSESRIIITTRDKHVLKICGPHDAIIYEVGGLQYDEALKLFKQCAFKGNNHEEDYWEISKRVVRYAKGVPLALKVLGSFLCGRKKNDWESALAKLEKVSHMDIQKVLKISYDGLNDEEKNIFLDIACFFKGCGSKFVKEILDACSFFPQIGIDVLMDKCLITITFDNNIEMHDLLQEMGREIVRQESISDLGKRSRLWRHEDIYHVLMKKGEVEAIQGIFLDMSKVRDIPLNPHAFSMMHNLRILKVYNSYNENNNNKLHGFEDLDSFSSELRYFSWDRYPFKSLPLNFQAANLVRLEIPHSKLKKLWNGVQYLVNLKYINLSCSKHLIELPNLAKALNLQELNLEGCTSLFEITAPNLNKLAILNLKDCKSLCSLPTSIESKSLTDVILSGCSNVKAIPKLPYNLERLYLDGTKIKELPMIESPSRLVILDLKNCSRLESVQAICNFKCLLCLDLSYCQRLQSLPKLPRGLDIQAYNCTSLESLSDASFIFSNVWRIQKVNFANCFKLTQSFIDKLKDALVNYRHKEFFEACSATICFPGNEIPEWFSFQSMGTSLILQFPAGWINKNCFAFVMSVVIAPGYIRNIARKINFRVCCTCTISTKDGWIQESICLWNEVVEPNYFESDHVLFGYDFLMCSVEEELVNKVSIEFHVDDPYLEVKKCGAHLLYCQDCGEPMEDYNKSFNYDKEEELEPSPKRLKVFNFL